MTETVRVIIKYKDKQMTANAVEALGGSIKDSFDSINAVSADVPVNKIGKIKTDPNVEYVEIDAEAHILGFPSEYDTTIIPVAGEEFRTKLAASQTVPWGIQKIKAPEVHAAGNKGTGIKVCIIDTGIDYNHPDLATNYKGGYNFVKGTNDPMDDQGHGSHCAGTIAALDNDIGVIGVAPEASIYSCKVLDSSGSGSYSNIVAAIQWAIDNKMQIISMSLGGSSTSQALQDICNAAYNSGILLIAAAGNSDGDGSKDTVGYPAKYSSVVAVASTDSNDARSSFSSCGVEVDVAAPGSAVLSTVPSGSCSLCDPSGYKTLSGTSMACPHTAGTAALVFKAYPGITNVNVRKTLESTSVDLGSQGRDIFFGFGRIDAKAATGNAPVKKFSCSGSPNFICTEDPNGIYDSLAACQAGCVAPGTRFNCSGAPDFTCVVDPNGPYDTLAACKAACKAPVIKYRCTGAPNYECVVDPNGQYDSLTACQTACRPAPTPKIFRINTIGSQTKPSGALVMKSSRGDYDAEEACKEVCNIIKRIK